ncbi:short integuments 2, mitochondrial-like [Quercus lobata]|uniref:short integuments 2, mitochondrial-like n=1 Tax=Quercus lobata TaxID=97700 RepID=UPI001243A414|nr:short integuments 2, mitochondrial-like [Quercus lobata]
MVGVPNVANAGEDEACYCRPTPGVTQDIAGYKLQIAHQPSIYVLETPGVLVPSILDIETELKLAFAGSVKDSVVGEE